MSLEVDKLRAEKTRMTKAFHKELMVYKQKEMTVIHNFNRRHLKESDFIPVQFYDSISGLDKHTQEIVISKINEVQEMAQYKLSLMVQQNEKQNEKIK